MELTLASGDYAHVRPLVQAGLELDGRPVRLRWVVDKPSAVFAATTREDLPFDIAEMSLATAHVLVDRQDSRFVVLPVFPSRMFRHHAFYVRAGSGGIERPEQLKGGRLGVVRYGMTAAVWARDLLREGYGIAPQDLTWWIGEPQFFQPPGLELHVAEGEAGLEQMLLDGGLDCLFSVDEPPAFREGRLWRLFPDYGAAERAHYQRTGLLPIMHCVLLKRSLAEAHPGLPAAVMAGFHAAKQAALHWLTDTDVSTLPMPFQHAWAEDVRALVGDDPWPYGVAGNRPVLEHFGQLMHDQGLTAQRLRPEDVFMPLEP